VKHYVTELSVFFTVVKIELQNLHDNAAHFELRNVVNFNVLLLGFSLYLSHLIRS
jgi:hypothetical protein